MPFWCWELRASCCFRTGCVYPCGKASEFTNEYIFVCLGMSVCCIMFRAVCVCLTETLFCCSGGWQPYWHFLWWFLWAYSIRITEGFHLVCSSLHAKEVSLEPLFTNQVGFAALIHSQAKAQLPSNPLQCLSLCPPHPHPHKCTHTLNTLTPTRQSLRLSFCRSSLVLLFARISSKLSRLRAFYVNLAAQNCEAMVTSQIRILHKTKKGHFKQNCLTLQITKLKGDCVVALTN